MIKEESGMTLLEILVAVMILSLLAVTFTTIFSSSLNSIYSSGDRYEALIQAQGLLERALRDPALGEEVGIYREVTSQKVAGTNLPGVLITAQVNYKNATGQTRKVELSVFQAQSDEVYP